MVQNIPLVRQVVSENDLITPTSTQLYPLGYIQTVQDPDKKAVKKYMYVKSHNTLTAYVPYAITYSSTSGSEVITAAPSTLTAPGQLLCVPQVAFTSGYYGFVLIEGDGSVLMTAETYAVGDFLQVINAGAAAVVDGTSGAAAITTASFAICKAAGTTAVSRAAYLFGQKAVIATA